MNILWIRAAGILTLGAMAIAPLGCARNKKGAPANPVVTVAKPGTAPGVTEVRYRVVKDATPFFKYGPQQEGGPDLSLKKGTDVLMVKRAFGYSRVKTVDTQQVGYAATEDLAPLTVQQLVALAAASAPPSAPVQSVSGSGKKSRAIVGEYTLPPAGSGEQDSLPMPAGNNPTPPPNNMFRY